MQIILPSILVGRKMTMATRQEVLGLYRRIFRLARKWQAASGQMEDTIKEKQYILNEARTLFQKNKNVSRPRWILQGGEQFLWCLFISFLSYSWEDWAAQIRGTECGARRGQRHNLAGLPNHWKTEASLGFCLHFLQVSVQLVSGSASSEDCVSQVTWISPVRIFRVELVPHTLCLLSVTPTGSAQSCVWFFQFISYSEPPSINPFRGKRIRLRQKFPL